MFFDLILLRRQHGGRMGHAWIAATRGIKHMKKKDIVDVNLARLCDDIMGYIGTNTTTPRQRFSLRLSSVLINGTIKLYREQVTIFLEEVVAHMSSISVPSSSRLSLGVSDLPGFFATPPTPVIKVRGKKRRRPVDKDTPEQVLARMISQVMDAELRQLPIDVATVQEKIVIQQRTDDLILRENLAAEVPVDLYGGFGALGAALPFPQEDNLQAFSDSRRTGPVPLMVQSPRLTIEEITTDIPSIHPTVVGIPMDTVSVELRPTDSSPDQGPVKITIIADVHVSAAEPARQSRRKLLAIDTGAVQPEQIPQAAPVATGQPEQPLREMSSNLVEIRRQAKARKKKPTSKFYVNLTPKKTVRLDRCTRFVKELVDIVILPKPQQHIKGPNLTSLMAVYMVGTGNADRPSELLDSQTSLQRRPSSLPRGLLGQTPPLMNEIAQSTPVPLRSSTPLPLSLTASQLGSGDGICRTVEQTIACAGQTEQPPHAPKRRRLALEEPEMVSVDDGAPYQLSGGIMAAHLESELPIEKTAVTVESPKVMEQERHQDIIDKLIQSTEGRVTLEDLCTKPYTKLKIARALGDVLELAKAQYVLLESEGDSTELKYVRVGPKLRM